MKIYRCKHSVEAVRWIDTVANREAIATWFDNHGAVFETRGPVVVLPDEDTAGEWIVFSDHEFIVLDDEQFRAEYEEIA